MEPKSEEMKICRICERDLSITMFSTKPRRHVCKDCHRFQMMQSHARRKDRILSQNKNSIQNILSAGEGSPLSEASTQPPSFSTQEFEELQLKIGQLDAKIESYEREIQDLKEKLDYLLLKDSKYKALKLYAQEKLLAKHSKD